MPQRLRFLLERITTIVLVATATGCGAATFTETPVDVSSIDVASASVTVAVGQTTTLSAVPKSAKGSSLTARAVHWASSKTSIASITDQGVLTGVAPGTATLTVTSGTVSRDVAVTVNAVVSDAVASLAFDA